MSSTRRAQALAEGQRQVRDGQGLPFPGHRAGHHQRLQTLFHLEFMKGADDAPILLDCHRHGIVADHQLPLDRQRQRTELPALPGPRGNDGPLRPALDRCCGAKTPCLCGVIVQVGRVGFPEAIDAIRDFRDGGLPDRLLPRCINSAHISRSRAPPRNRLPCRAPKRLNRRGIGRSGCSLSVTSSSDRASDSSRGSARIF